MTDQQQIDAELDRRTRRTNWIFWPIYIGLLSFMIFLAVSAWTNR